MVQENEINSISKFLDSSNGGVKALISITLHHVLSSSDI